MRWKAKNPPWYPRYEPWFTLLPRKVEGVWVWLEWVEYTWDGPAYWPRDARKHFRFQKVDQDGKDS